MSKEFKLSNETVLVSTDAPGGIYNAQQLTLIAELTSDGAAMVKATEDQRLALFVQPDALDTVSTRLQESGLGVRHYQDGLHQPTSCVGAMCPSFAQDALSTAIELTEQLAEVSLDTALKIGVNGCPTCCVPTHTLDISIVGDVNGYRISLGGKNSQIPEMAMFMAEAVPADKVVDLIKKVISVYQEKVDGDESLQEVMERCGNAPFVSALAPYSQDAASDGDPFADFASVEEPAADSSAEEIDPLDLIDESDLLDDDSEQVSSEPMSELTEADEEIDPMSLIESDADVEGVVDGIDIDSLDVEEDTGFDDVSEELIDDELIDEVETNLEPEIVEVEAEITEELVSEDQDAEELSAEELEEFDAEEVSEAEADEFEEKLNASIQEQEKIPESRDENLDERMEAVNFIESGAQSGAPNSTFEDNSHGTTDTTWQFAGLDHSDSGKLVIMFTSGAELAFDLSTISAERMIAVGNTTVTLTPDSNGCHIEIGDIHLFLPKIAA